MNVPPSTFIMLNVTPLTVIGTRVPIVGLGFAAGFAGCLTGIAGFEGCCCAGAVVVGFFLGCLPLYWHLGMESPQTGHFLLGAWADMPKVNTAKSRNNSIFFIMSYEFFSKTDPLRGYFK